MSLAIKIALAPWWVGQAVRLRRRAPRLPEAVGPRKGHAGPAGGKALKLLVAGDSSAAGVGVPHQRQALAGPLARYLAEASGRRVDWNLVARSGVNTAQLLHLLQAAPPWLADVAVVVTGVNDVADQVPSHRAVSDRDTLANWFRNVAGVRHVVFAPLPPVHQFPALPRPLRWVAGADAQRHNKALADWARQRNDVSFVDIRLSLNPGVMASDGLHPGEPVYRQCSTMIARHIAERIAGDAPHHHGAAA